MKVTAGKIDKDIPMPKRKTCSYKFPLADMQVGDSFIVSGMSRSSLSCYLCNHIKRRGNGWKLSTRRMDDRSIRVWRVK